MKIRLLFLLVFTSGVVSAQKFATLYYNENWEITAKDSSSYYRVCVIDTLNYLFVGEVKDFQKDGKLLMKGVYKLGVRNGEFITYYPTGQIESQGEFMNGNRLGVWKYFNPDGKLLREVTFNNDSFFVNSLIDSAGNVLIKDGNGEWKYEYEWYQSSVNFLIHGWFTNGLKDKDWECRTSDGKLIYVEKFKGGKFKKGEYFDRGTKIVYTDEQPNKFSIPYKFEVTEKFLYAEEVTRAHYPFLNFLPKPISKDTLENELFLVVEKTARPVGGMQAFYEFIGRNLKYPAEARQRKIQGKVFVEFVVNRDGTISDVKAIKGIGGGCDAEAVRVISISPKWQPGTLRGDPVRQRMVLPITFKLG